LCCKSRDCFSTGNLAGLNFVQEFSIQDPYPLKTIRSCNHFLY